LLGWEKNILVLTLGGGRWGRGGNFRHLLFLGTDASWGVGVPVRWKKSKKIVGRCGTTFLRKKIPSRKFGPLWDPEGSRKRTKES